MKKSLHGENNIFYSRPAAVPFQIDKRGTLIRLIFVCTANRCRSQMAEGIMRDRWTSVVGSGLQVSSMGIHGMDNQPPTDFAIQVCAENNIAIEKQVSRPLVTEEIKQADLVLVMEPFHKEYLKIFFPYLDDLVFLLAAWPQKTVSKKAMIKDPVGGSIKVYRKTFMELSKCVDRIIPELRSEFGY
jgi:protein-tyrosine-phosphatase